MTLTIPKRLADTCRSTPEQADWLQRLPNVLHDLADRWSLTLGAPFDGDEVSCAWVAPAQPTIAPETTTVAGTMLR